MAKADAAQLAERATNAKKVADQVIRKANRIGSDETVNRSTRTRRALNIKAEGLEQIRGVLAGKA